jgi:hypothetical protein
MSCRNKNEAFQMHKNSSYEVEIFQGQGKIIKVKQSHKPTCKLIMDIN